MLLPAFGRLSDVVGRKPVIVGGIVAEALLAFPLFWLLDTREFPFALLGYLLMMTAFAANYGPIATFLAELFGTQVRYSGLSDQLHAVGPARQRGDADHHDGAALRHGARVRRSPGT